MSYIDHTISFSSFDGNIVSVGKKVGNKENAGATINDFQDNEQIPSVINALEIDWNGANLGDISTEFSNIHSTGQLLKAILSVSQNAGGTRGPQGFQGPRGYQGAQGAQGIKGPQGVIGTVGPKGNTGPQGLPGPQGPQGPAGKVTVVDPTGNVIEGAQGAQGPQGPRGYQGVQGAKGETVYISGAQGGAQGPQGRQGAQGPQGPAGQGIEQSDINEIISHIEESEQVISQALESLNSRVSIIEQYLGIQYNG